jgi:hypothetical protein
MHSVLASVQQTYFKGTTTHPPNSEQAEVSTYLALTFGTLLSSQGTDTSFRRLPPTLRAFRSFTAVLLHCSLLRFTLYQTVSDPISAGLGRCSRPVPTSETLAEFLEPSQFHPTHRIRACQRKATPTIRGMYRHHDHNRASRATRGTLRMPSTHVKPIPCPGSCRGWPGPARSVRPGSGSP